MDKCASLVIMECWKNGRTIPIFHYSIIPFVSGFVKKLFLFQLCFLFSTNIFSQRITIKERHESIGSGTNPALVVTIHEADISVIEKSWKSLMKGCDAKVTMGGEIFADNAKIKGFENTCDVYARVKTINDIEKELIVGVDMGGAYLSSANANQFRKMENILYEFALEMTKNAISQQIKDEEKTHKKLLKEQENLMIEKEQLLKDIETYKTKITETENRIKENEKLQETKKLEIENRAKIVEEVKVKYNSVK